MMGGDPNDLRNQDIVRQMRSDDRAGGLRRRSRRRGPSSPATPAYTLDVVDFYVRGMPEVIAFVLSLSFLLLLVAFRSIVIPIKAILLNLLSTGAAFGLLVVVFQDGLARRAARLQAGPDRGVRAGLHLHDPVRAIDGLPRLHPHPDQGGPRSRDGSNEAVARGISITSGTITSAAAIMVVVFAVFVTLG